MLIKKLYGYVCDAEAIVAGTFLVLMVALIFGGAVARLVGNPMNWTTDAATCLFAWACFICADIAWRKDKLMSVDVVTHRLPAKAQKVCRLLNYAVLTLFLLYIIGAGTWLSYISRARSFQGIPAVSYSWVTASLAVGGLLLLITTLSKLSHELGGARLPAASIDTTAREVP